MMAAGGTEKKKWRYPAIFVLLEVVLYGLILTTDGKVLICAEFVSVLLCFLFALSRARRETVLLVCGLAFTVCADFCLVICDPIEQLWGMIFFSGTQLCYGWMLRRHRKHRGLLIARVALCLAAEAMAAVILRENADPLALVSMFYYANLLMNAAEAFSQFRSRPLFAVGMVLFILCDTVIGLQVAAGGYLSIPQDAWLHRLLFMDFHLSWFFYLPSQVLITLSGRGKQ